MTPARGARVRQRARFSPPLVLITCLVCLPAAVFAGSGGDVDRPLLVAMALLVSVAMWGAWLSRRVVAPRREVIAIAVIVATSVLILATADRSEVPISAWFGAVAAATVGMATIRDSRVRLLSQAVVILALGVLLVLEHPDPVSLPGATGVFGPLLLVVVIAGLSSALADDLAFARQRELATRRAAERRAELLLAVRELSAAGPGEACDITVEALQGLGFPVAAVLLAGPDGLRARRVAGIEYRADYGQGVSGHAFSTGRTVVSGDYRSDDLRLPGLELGSVVATPIQADGRTLGVLTTGRPDAGSPPMGDVEVVEVLAAHLGGALANERVVENQHALLARLRHLDSLRASFVDRVSEDLRDPLTVVRGVAQTLATYGERLPEHQRRMLLDRLTVQADDLAETLEALLDFSRVHVGRTDPRPEPTGVIELLAPVLAGTGATLEVSGRPEVRVDRELVRRAFRLLRRASFDADAGFHLRRVGEELLLDVRLRQLDALQGGFARALAEQLFVAGGVRSERLSDGLRLRFPVVGGEGTR